MLFSFPGSPDPARILPDLLPQCPRKYNFPSLLRHVHAHDPRHAHAHDEHPCTKHDNFCHNHEGISFASRRNLISFLI